MTLPATAFLTDGPKGVFVICDYVFSLIAVLVNVVVLRSVLGAKIHLTGYKYCLTSLGASNLYLCLVNIAIFVVEAARLLNYDSDCWGQIFRSLQITGLIANLLNLSYMSFDHLIGIVYPFIYHKVTRKSILRVAMTILWVAAILLGCAEIPLTTVLYVKEASKTESASPMAMNPDCVPDSNFDLSSVNLGNFSLGDINLEGLDLTQADPSVLLSMHTSMDRATQQVTAYQTATKNKPTSTSSSTARNKNKKKGKPGNDRRRVRDGDGIFSILDSTNATTNSDPCFIASLLDAITKAGKKRTQRVTGFKSWCTILKNTSYLEYVIMGLTLICFSFVAFCYGKIFKEIYFTSNNDGGGAPNSKHNVRKLVMTTFMLLGTFAICYLPFMVFELIMVLAMHFDIGSSFVMKSALPSFMATHNVFNSLLIMSPLLQPLLYAGRLSVVRRQIFRDLRKMRLRCCCCCCRPVPEREDSDVSRARHSSMAGIGMTLLDGSNGIEYESAARSLCNNHHRLSHV